MVIVVIDCIHLSSIIFSRRGFNLVPNNAGSYIYIYIRDTEVYLKLREGKNHERSENHFSRNDRVHDYFGMKRLRREENLYGGGTRKEKRIA